MRICFAILLLVLASPVAAQSLQDCYNNIGIFNEPDPDLDDVCHASENCGFPGIYTVYVVLINPYNEHTGTPIQEVGAYDFRVNHSPALFVTPTLPAGVVNQATFPDLSCSGSVPVIGNRSTLLTLEIGTFGNSFAAFYLEPISAAGGQRIAGEMAIADAGDEWSLSRATPLFRDFEIPVYWMWCDVLWTPCSVVNDWDSCWIVPNVATSWGSLKAMFR